MIASKSTKVSRFKSIVAASALGIAAVLSTGVANAANVIVDFSGFSEGQVLNGAFNFGGGVTGTISTVANGTSGGHTTGEAMVFDTSPGSLSVGNDPDLKSNFTNVFDSNDQRDFGNALILQERGASNPDDAARGGQIIFSFDSLVSLTRIFILDGNDNGPTGVSLFLNSSLSPVATHLGGGNRQFEIHEFDPNTVVSQLTVDFAGSGAIGQFGFAAVPVPASLPLLLTALGGFAWAARRRRKTAVV